MCPRGCGSAVHGLLARCTPSGASGASPIKGAVDPNTADLALLHQSAAWIMAELLRNATGISMEDAGALIEKVQTPVGTLVEEIEDTRLVHTELSVTDELLVLLHSVYPEYMAVADIMQSLKARDQGTEQVGRDEEGQADLRRQGQGLPANASRVRSRG